MKVNTTVALVLRSDREKPDGTRPVYLRVTASRKRSWLATGVAVKPSDWNERRREVRRSHPLYRTLNAELSDLRLQAEALAASATTAKEVTAALRGGTATVQSYARAHVERLRESGAHWEAQKYASTARKAEAALGGGATFESVTRADLGTLARYMMTPPPAGLGNGSGTARKDLSRLRRLFKLARRDGVTKADPFEHFDFPAPAKPKRRKLTAEELGALAGAELAEEADAPLRLARDAFLFAVYAAGMRFGDVCSLRASDVAEAEGGRYRVRYRMMKTSTPVDVPLPPPAVEIAERYRAHGGAAQGGTGKDGAARDGAFLFPILRAGDDRDATYLRRRISSRNVIINRDLKRLAERAGIEPDGLSFHVARHTFADLARTRSGDLYAVSKALGHSSLTVTQQYLKTLDRDAVDALADSVWGDYSPDTEHDD
jgi:integrase